MQPNERAATPGESQSQRRRGEATAPRQKKSACKLALVRTLEGHSLGVRCGVRFA